jgi:RNA polymerase sigma-70 factor (ECF subfamily)
VKNPPIRWLLERVADPPRDPEAITSARDGLDQVFAVLDHLSPKERAAFTMYHLDGLGVVEIARNLGHTKGYVSKLLARAEAKVKEASGV